MGILLTDRLLRFLSIFLNTMIDSPLWIFTALDCPKASSLIVSPQPLHPKQSLADTSQKRVLGRLSYSQRPLGHGLLGSKIYFIISLCHLHAGLLVKHWRTHDDKHLYTLKEIPFPLHLQCFHTSNNFSYLLILAIHHVIILFHVVARVIQCLPLLMPYQASPFTVLANSISPYIIPLHH